MPRSRNPLVFAGCLRQYGLQRKSPFDNSAYLNVAATKNAETFTFNRKVTSQTKTFTVKLSYPSGDDVKVNLKVDPSLVGAYNAKNDTHYEMLPAEHYQLSQESVTIPAGKITSDEVGIKFLKLDELEIDATYLCPLSISGAEGVGIMDGSRTMYYLVRRSSAITTAINLKNVYVTVPGFDKGSPTADVVNNLSAVTMEAIIRVNSFQPEISSIMGIEMYLQMRIGDANFPNQQLQVQTTYGKFPDASKQKLLLAGEWYHVALTWDLATATIAYYVNGQLQSISTSHGKSDLTSISLGDKVPDDEFGNGGDHNFYFGRSYTESHDLSRQFNGEICEARIWSIAVHKSRFVRICMIFLTRPKNLLCVPIGSSMREQGWKWKTGLDMGTMRKWFLIGKQATTWKLIVKQMPNYGLAE